MSIKEIIGFILCSILIIGLFILLIWSMKSSIRIEEQRKKKQIEFYNAFIEWCHLYTKTFHDNEYNDSDSEDLL